MELELCKRRMRLEELISNRGFDHGLYRKEVLSPSKVGAPPFCVRLRHICHIYMHIWVHAHMFLCMIVHL